MDGSLAGRVLRRRVRRSLVALRSADRLIRRQLLYRLKRAPARPLGRLWPRPLWEAVVPSDVLFLVATYGNGHVQAARALGEAMAQASPERRGYTVDFFELVNPVLNAAARMAYMYSVRQAPRLWREFYVRTGRIPPDSFLQQRLYHLGMGALQRVLERARPAVVISTHPTPGGVVAQLRQDGALPDAVGVTVITDFVLHSQWVHPATDLYLVACPAVADDLVRRGIPARRIRVTGIPIRPAFARPVDREAARQRWGVEPGVPLVVLLTGAFGMMRGAMEAALRLGRLGGLCKVVVVTGHDHRLRAVLQEAFAGDAAGVQVVGFVEAIHELMAAADVLVTKAGGLTVSEALAVGVPMVIYAPIPGQEEGNAAYLEAQGAARVARTPAEMAAVVQRLLGSEAERLQLAEQARRIGRPDSARAAWAEVAAVSGL